MDTHDKIWHLISRTLNGEASAREQEELIEVLKQDESLYQQFDLLTRIWKEKEGNIQYEDSDAARNTISRIITRAESEGRHIESSYRGSRLRKRKMGMAAVLMMVVVLGAWLWINNKTSAGSGMKQEALEARNGSRSRNLLPDGTTVWLNAGSKLFYDGNFTGDTREVRLEGEAFFDVVVSSRPSPDGVGMVNRPFIVHASGIEIKVLGTAFNVKSYPDDKTVETTLFRGSVSVFRKEDSEKTAIRLKPNEKLIILRQAANIPSNLSEEIPPSASAKEIPASFTIANIDSTKKENERLETAWLYSRLEFRKDSFEELARKLERWYNVTIVFMDEKVKQLSFTGSFETENIAQAFAGLQLANSFFTYKINNHEILVSSSQ